jgi:hypothetical protein
MGSENLNACHRIAEGIANAAISTKLHAIFWETT